MYSKNVNMAIVITLLFAFLVLMKVTPVSAVVPTPLPLENGSTRLEVITQYFHAGFKYAEIVLLLLCRHNIHLGLRQLKRILRANNLRRRRITYTPLAIVQETVEKELQFSGDGLGYRSMWKRLQYDYNFKVKRHDVMVLLRNLDPLGVRLRKAHKLKRRKYLVPGPNYVWHIDGYDKLKPFGLCIHGAMDGYSRRIMWLEVGSTNNNAKTIAKYYLDTVASHGLVPRIVRADRGTENSKISFLQPFLRNNHDDSMAGLKSFMYGKSTANQRIERWWGYLKQQGINWWRNTLHDLRDRGRIDASNPLHVECLRFCVTDVLQSELDRIAIHWNLHSVRPQKNVDICTGKPEILFNVPELTGSTDYGVDVDIQDVEICQELYTIPKRVCSEAFKELAYMLKPDLQLPGNAIKAFELYETLLDAYEELTTHISIT